ncbi:wax ester synthase/diacylglycerol acyltransferase 11-like [Hordeum vulgare subsp. vulgare]|uniref:Diacylglycerol O-acyltransferase n=1 Tax=Hordeum vulgare subsp. vulgare TaxID=112509 RepID=A0A8I6YBI4_HORVV|nr:wax ester synthase/diacylglycerol acyltransferase 11-like [Hordeum vulgare subsp. vulgare]
MDSGSGSPWASVPRNRLLPIRVSTEPAGTEWTPENPGSPAEEPVSPTARAMDDIGIYIVVTFGLDTPVNLTTFRAGIEAMLARCPRYGCIQVARDGSNNGEARWVRTTVNVDDHMIVPRLDRAAMATDPDKAVEDYVATLSTLPMDSSRAPWEFHFLDFPTSEAASTVAIRVHHAYGDGMSLLALLMMSTGAAADTKQGRPPAAPAPPRRRRPTRTGAIYAPRRRPPLSAGALALVAWVWSYLELAWNTAADVAYFAATILFLGDPRTLFKRADDDEFHAKRFVHRSLSLDDVKFVKNSMDCTVNDVLVALTSAALSRYYFRTSGDANTRKICLRSLLPVNTRPATTLQTYANVIESDKRKEVTWGNKLGYIILPFYLAMHEDPLAYIRKAKKVLDRKKRSLEVIFTYKVAQIFMKVFGVKVGTSIFRCLFARTTIVFSNMVGPAEQVELCGHPVAFIAPSVYGIPEALIIHYQSYRSTIKIILSVDEDRFPHYHQLLGDFDQTLTAMKDAASRLSTSTKND